MIYSPDGSDEIAIIRPPNTKKKGFLDHFRLKTKKKSEESISNEFILTDQPSEPVHHKKQNSFVQKLFGSFQRRRTTGYNSPVNGSLEYQGKYPHTYPKRSTPLNRRKSNYRVNGYMSPPTSPHRRSLSTRSSRAHMRSPRRLPRHNTIGSPLKNTPIRSPRRTPPSRRRRIHPRSNTSTSSSNCSRMNDSSAATSPYDGTHTMNFMLDPVLKLIKRFEDIAHNSSSASTSHRQRSKRRPLNIGQPVLQHHSSLTAMMLEAVSQDTSHSGSSQKKAAPKYRSHSTKHRKPITHLDFSRAKCSDPIKSPQRGHSRKMMSPRRPKKHNRTKSKAKALKFTPLYAYSKNFFPSLRHLSFPRSCIITFYSLYLTQLNLSHSNLSSYPLDVMSLPLQSLDLSHNLIDQVPSTIFYLHTLKQLNLSFNQITSLPENLSGLSALESFNLNHNILTTLPHSIGYLERLHTLKVRDNRIQTLPASISRLNESLNIFEVGEWKDITIDRRFSDKLDIPSIKFLKSASERIQRSLLIRMYHLINKTLDISDSESASDLPLDFKGLNVNEDDIQRYDILKSTYDRILSDLSQSRTLCC